MDILGKKVMIVNTKPYDEFRVGNILANFGLELVPEHHTTEKDVILAIGGDSAVLKASRYNLPILAWNQGHLGFLTTGTDLEEILNEYVKGSLLVEKRRKLCVNIDFKIHTALNEVAIVGEETGRLVETDLYLDDRQITTYKGDGLLIATPTGSTAWNLSAGGSLVEFGVSCMLITPMNPFTMNVRPLIIDSYHQIELRKVKKIVLDGHDIIVPKRDRILIEYDDKFVKIYRQKEENFFDAIKEKLGWNENIKR